LKSISQAFRPSQTKRSSKCHDLKTNKKKGALFRQEEKAYRKDTAHGQQPGLMIHKDIHRKGKRRDYNIYKKNHPVTPYRVVSVFDLGYLTVEKNFPGQLSALPNRKKRNAELPRGKMEYNQEHAKKRIVRAHHLQDKKYKMMSDVFRNKLRKYNKASNMVSGLINYRIINLLCCMIPYFPNAFS
jgi:hypothetical protein